MEQTGRRKALAIHGYAAVVPEIPVSSVNIAEHRNRDLYKKGTLLNHDKNEEAFP